MRLKLICVVVAMSVASITVALGAVPFPQAQNSGQPFVITDEVRRHVVAVNFQDSGRVVRPKTWDELNPDQKTFVDAMLNSPRGELRNSGAPHPFGMFLDSPVMGNLFQQAQGYARFTAGSTRKLNELAIVIVTRTWNSNYAWRAHKGSAVAAGVSPDVVEAIRLGKRPMNMPPDVEAVYNFCTEFLNTKQVSDPTFQAAKAVLGGDKGVVDLTATMGFYQMISMFHNLDQFPLPPGVKPEELIPGAPVHMEK
jgi:4-carboxymuconolactone decarboxylase